MAEEELHKTDADVSANDAADSNATVTDDVVVDAATDSEGDAVAVESETVTEEPQTDSEKKAEREEKRAEDNEKRAEEAAVVSEEEADDLSLDKIQAVLNSTIDEKDMSPQMRRMVKRQQENTKRVEECDQGHEGQSELVRAAVLRVHDRGPHLGGRVLHDRQIPDSRHR